jgi:hypothetical protein
MLSTGHWRRLIIFIPYDNGSTEHPDMANDQETPVSRTNTNDVIVRRVNKIKLKIIQPYYYYRDNKIHNKWLN